MTMEEYTTGTGQVLQVHEGVTCLELHCVIHRPLSGPWQDWPTHWRDDRSIMERICPHGIGHPAPEQFEHWKQANRLSEAIHDCDGCCQPGRDQ